MEIKVIRLFYAREKYNNPELQIKQNFIVKIIYKNGTLNYCMKNNAINEEEKYWPLLTVPNIFYHSNDGVVCCINRFGVADGKDFDYTVLPSIKDALTSKAEFKDFCKWKFIKILMIYIISIIRSHHIYNITKIH